MLQLVLSSGERPRDETEAQFRPSHLKLKAYLQETAPASFRWRFLDLPGKSHSQTPYFSIAEGLWFVQDGSLWDIPAETMDSLFTGKLDPIEVGVLFYRDLSNRVGYEVAPSAKWLKLVADIYLMPEKLSVSTESSADRSQRLSGGC